MKYFIFLFCLYIGNTAFSQKAKSKFQDSLYSPNCRCGQFPPRSSTMRSTASTRLKNFQKRKHTCGNSERDEIAYAPEAFLQLFNKVNDNKLYDGFRIYLAKYPDKVVTAEEMELVPADQVGKLALIFVPTWKTDDKKVHRDDLLNVLTIKDKAFVLVKPGTAANWIRNAEASYIQAYEDEAAKTLKKPDYKETRSLWYGGKILRDNTVGFKGLIYYLNCRICAGTIDQVYARLGGFNKVRVNHRYQLTLLFDYYGMNGTSAFMLPVEAGFVQQTTDTGKPCPPPSGGCTTEGAILAEQ